MGWPPVNFAPPIPTISPPARDTTRVLLDVVRSAILVRAGETVTWELADERARNVCQAIIGIFALAEWEDGPTQLVAVPRRAAVR